jgi:membrane fusion protein (multidrug efflux system)
MLDNRRWSPSGAEAAFPNTMSDSLRKVLLGALIGALVVGFAWHIAGERAKRAPEMQGGATASAAPKPGATPGGASARPAGGPVVRVVAMPSRVERLSLVVEALGTARANESIDVTSKVSNVVSAVRFVEGQQVRRGELLVELDGDQARADLAVAEAALTESASQLRRSRELYATKVLSDQQIEQIEATHAANTARVAAAQARVGDTMIRAPFAGRVGLRRVSVGSLVAPGTLITTLDDTHTIKLDFTVPETVIAAMQSGLLLEASSIAYPDQRFAGRVASVDSRVDPQTRSITVRATVPNERGLLKPGMFLNVRLARGEADMLVVPEESLVPEQGEVFVYVVRDGTVAKRKIETGQRRVGTVQVVAGLEPGELVVTEGTQKLRDGASVDVVEGSTAPTRAAAAASSPGLRPTSPAQAGEAKNTVAR